MIDHTNGQRLFERAKKVIPGGVFSNFKKEKDVSPVYIKSVEGAREIDVDGNVYYDFSLSAGPAILGNSNKALKEALKEQVDKFYSLQYCELQVEAAELICKYVPCAELVRFAVSGGEAVYNAVRVARAYTGKSKLLKFKGQYHGGMDYVLGGKVDDKDNPIVSDGIDPKDRYTKTCFTEGRAPNALDDCYMIDWNDLSEMERLFKNKSDIAAVVMEPVNLNMNGCCPEPGYLEGVRKLCDEYGVVFIMDETLTGFRMGIGGAQEFYGVTPDLSIFAKAVGGGFPAAIYCGKRQIMDVLTENKALGVGTYNGHPLAAAAIVATIKELAKDGCAVYKHIERLGNKLRDGFEDAARKNGIPMIMQGFPGARIPIFTKKGKIINHQDALDNSDFELQGKFLKLLAERKIEHNGRLCICAEHTDADVDYAIAQAQEALEIMARH